MSLSATEQGNFAENKNIRKEACQKPLFSYLCVMEKIETKKVVVESFNTDFQRRLNYETLGRDLLNCAEQHANKRGFGVDDLTSKNHAWVLSRLAIEMREMPTMFTELNISTWIESIYRLFTNRNFSIVGTDGTVYGYARSIWAMIDRDTRQPIELEKLYSKYFLPYIDTDTPCPISPMSHLRPLKEATLESQYTPVASDIDYNGHVNSMKYIQHMCDLVSLDDYRRRNLARLEIAYINETHFGETLGIHTMHPDNETLIVEMRKPDGSTAVRGLMRLRDKQV